MKRILIASAVLLFGGVGVAAADLGGMKGGASSYQDVSAPVGSWTGVYFGAHAGYGWNSHDLKMTEREVTPGTDAYCKDGAQLKDGKCYTSVDVPGVSASCNDGAQLKDGKCYTTVEITPAVPEFCRTGVLKDGACYPISLAEHCATGYSMFNHACYSSASILEDCTGDGDSRQCSVVGVKSGAVAEANALIPAELSSKADEDAYVAGQAAVTEEKEKADAYNPPVEASTKLEEKSDAYVAAVDAKTTITNTLLAIDPDGIFGGIHAGADYQVPNGRLVFGVFGDFNLADNDQIKSGLTVNDGNSYLIAGRVGALINDKTLLYALAGYGWQDVTYSGDSKSIDKTFGHVVAGGGLEYKFTKELSFSLEGQHWFESDEKIVSTVDADGSSFELTDARSDTRVLARVNYRFGGN